MTRYSWVLFDADGTLFDYDRAELAALQRTFEEAGQVYLPGYLAAYREINARLWLNFEQGAVTQERLKVQRFADLLDALSLQADALALSRRYLSNLAEGIDLIEGAEEVVQALHGIVGLVVITNGLKEVQRPRLQRSTIGRFFTDVVISEEIGSAKPDRGIFDAAFARMGNPGKKEVLMVGDSLTSDILGASLYGIDACWYNPTGAPAGLQARPRYEIGRLAELVGIICAVQG